jgi:alanine dehydrogenase
MVASMRPGSVVIDISIDQGGCIETAHMTTHSDPTYVVEGVVHYCVGNMPARCRTPSTYALTNVTRPYASAIADRGLEDGAPRRPGAGPGPEHLPGARSPTSRRARPTDSSHVPVLG